MPKASTPPQNVIPFTKPRAISQIAAQHPGAVTMSPNNPFQAPAPTTVKPARMLDAPTRIAPMPTLAPTSSPAPAMPAPVTAAPVSSSWGARPVPQAKVPQHAMPQHGMPQYPPPAQSWPQPAPAPQQSWPQPAPAPQPQQAWLQPQHAPAPQPPAPAPQHLPAPQHAPAQQHAAPATPPQPEKWAQYEQLGLGAPKKPLIDSQQAAKWLVSAYRLLGFAILTLIVVVLVGYIASTAFFYMSSSWAVPMAITTSDEKVVSLQAQLAEQQNQRDRIADELKQAERSIAAQQDYQTEFGMAIKGDLDGRKLALGKMRELASVAAGTRAAIQNQNRAYAGAAKKRMNEEYAAGLIDRTAMLSGKFQLAQISSSNLSLAERQAEYETKAAELESNARSLDAILANAQGAGDTALSYEVLQIKQQYETSRLELAKAMEMRNTLKASLARQDKIIASLKGSAYLRAVNDGATVAFVPYANLPAVKKGASIYGCSLTMFWCHHVGDVLEVLPGEVTGHHPHRDKALRGQLVELKLDAEDGDAGAEDVLFVGSKPLFL